MNYFVVIATVCCILAAVPSKAEEMQQRSYGGGSAAAASPAASSYSAAAPTPASYHAPPAVSIPAPPCPKNYLFSCQPSLTPAPCAPPAAASYGGAGAYSHDYPVYALPQFYNGYQPYY